MFNSGLEALPSHLFRVVALVFVSWGCLSLLTHFREVFWSPEAWTREQYLLVTIALAFLSMALSALCVVWRIK